MAQLTPQVIALAGITPTLVAAAAGGDEFVNSGRDFIHIKNGDASSMNVTINSQSPCSQGSDHDVVVAVPASTGEKFIGPFPKDRFNDASGKVQITYSAVTSVTIGIVRLP
jgi:hypothetical protein